MMTTLLWLVDSLTKYAAGSTPESQILGRLEADAARSGGWPVDALTVCYVVTSAVATGVVTIKQKVKQAKEDVQ